MPTDHRRAVAFDLMRQASLIDFEILEREHSPDGLMNIVLQIDQLDLETSAFALLFAISALSFGDARPAGVSEMHFDADDQWSVADMVQHLQFDAGRLHFFADYARGRLMKTTIDVSREGRVGVHTVNRGALARGWLDLLRGQAGRSPVSLVVEQPPRFRSSEGEPLQGLDDWQALHPALHWKKGRSAMRLAETWGGQDGFPDEVVAALGRSARFADLAFVKAVVEHETPMPGKGKASVTDIMVWADDDLGNPVILGVEGKVDEGFGQPVQRWMGSGKSEGSAQNRARRFRGICDGLDLDDRDPTILALPYQLLHRTYAAVLTAQDERAKRGVVLVHSFVAGTDAPRSGWDGFVAFSQALRPGSDSPVPGEPWRGGEIDGVELWLLWVAGGAGA